MNIVKKTYDSINNLDGYLVDGSIVYIPADLTDQQLLLAFCNHLGLDYSRYQNLIATPATIASTNVDLVNKVNELCAALWYIRPTLTVSTTTTKAIAKSLLNNEDPTVILLRNALRIVMASLIETRTKLNEVITYTNTHSGQPSTIAPLINRSWLQILTAVQSQIDNETDPGQ